MTETIRFWKALMTASTRLTEAVEAALKADGLPPLAWYDVLWEVEKAGEEGLRPFVLKDRLLLPQYATSRLLDRIAAAGLIDRDQCPEDGRGQILTLTEKGRAMRARMWPVYEAVLKERVGDFAGAAELAAAAKLLERLGAGQGAD